MSLIAHWPLNGDLNDISGNGNHLTNSGAVSETNGKIGECYSLAGTGISDGTATGTWTPGEYLELPNTSLADTSNYGKGTTYAFWINVDTDAADRLALLYGSGTISHVEIYSSSKYFRTEARLDNGYSFGAGSFPDDVRGVWSHFAIVFDTNDPNRPVRWYQNGILFHTHASLNTGDFTTEEYFMFYKIGQSTGSTSYSYAPSFKGKINDFRIYDHALSDKEIYLLSQAKVLHYTFNDFQEPTVNYYGDMANASNLRIPREDWTGDLPDELVGTNTRAYKFTSGALSSTWSGNSYGYMGMSTTCAASGEYATYSAWLYVSPDCNIDASRVTIEGETGSEANANYSYLYDMTKKGTWQKVSRKAISDGNMTGYFYPYKLGVEDGSFTGYFVWAGAQWEKGEYATPYTDSTRNGEVNDISGFKRHATMNADYSPRWVEDSALGSGSYNFITQRILYGPDFKITDQLTLACWVKPETARESGFIQGAFYLSCGSDMKLRAYWYGTSSAGYHTSPTTTIPVGEWTHVAAVWNGTQCILYQNGQQIHSADTNTPGNASGYVAIGTEGDGWPPTSTRQIDGNITDVRIYATGLSSGDILSLYEQKASLDNRNNLFINEVVERIDYGRDINNAIVNKVFEDGLSSYTQSNCQVTLTDEGYRIYRPPNLEYPEDGNTMWGGFYARLPEEAKQHGRTYRVRFKMKGQTTASMSDRRIAYNAGWSTMGIGLSSHSITNIKLANTSNFQETSYQILESEYTVDDNRWEYGTWNVDVTSGSNVVTYTDKHASAPDVTVGDELVDNSYFPYGTTVTSVTTDVSFTVSNNATATGTFALQTHRGWDTYYALKIGFTYQDTGVLGTDLYIKDFQIIDITDEPTDIPVSIKENSVLYIDSLSNVGITDGMVGYWPLNGHVLDYSGNNNDGTLVGTPTVDSGINNKLSYNINTADAEYIDLNEADIMDPNTGSVSMWINATTWDARRMCAFASQTGASWADLNVVMFSNSNNSMTFSISNGTTSINDTVNTGAILNTDQWYHLVGTYDGSNVRLYLDGSEIDSYATSITPGSFTNNLTAIGWHYSSRGFNGKICQVKVFDRALSAEEVAIEHQIFNTDRKIKQHEDGTLYIAGDINEGL